MTTRKKDVENQEMLPQNIVTQMMKERNVRIAITQQSHYMFFHFYFAHYVKYQTAPFQKEIFDITENDDIKNFFCCAFRGSGKSTIITMSYPIWAILGRSQKKFVLILCQTHNQAKQHMINLRRELEGNELLRNDLGPFHEESDEWGSASLVFSNTNARITAASSEQSIRGLRHGHHRPDLIIGDDVEDLASAKTRDGREKTYQWLTGEVIPAGDRDTKMVIIGNLLHEDSLLMHLKRDLSEGKIEGVFKEYPLVDQQGTILWPGKFPNMTTVEQEHRKTGNEIAWQREYLLRIIPSEEQVIHKNWIAYYDALPPDDDICALIIGVDLAISQKETADYTAIVCAILCGSGDHYRAYILPNSINKRMTFPETIDQIKILYNVMTGIYDLPKVVIENVGYQAAVIDQLKIDGISAMGIRITNDKRSRLMSVSSLIQNGIILFPREGSEELIKQILGFGVERHDDLVDAFTIVAHKAINGYRPTMGGIVWLDGI